MTMKEQLRAVAKEYARQFGKIIGVAPDYWVGGNISLGPCAYADYFFDLDSMQVIVDNLDKWVKKYGTIEKVGFEVIEWHDHTIGLEHPQNLFSWMNGHRPSDEQLELARICHQLDVLRDVVEVYPSHSVGNVIMQLEARVKELSKITIRTKDGETKVNGPIQLTPTKQKEN